MHGLIALEFIFIKRINYSLVRELLLLKWIGTRLRTEAVVL
jgi:hypothetical protein